MTNHLCARIDGVSACTPACWRAEQYDDPCPARCETHPAYEVDYCPRCKPSILIGRVR